MTTILLACFLTLVASATAHRGKRPGFISPGAWRVAVCETGKGHGHPDFRHHSGSYEGAFGWFHTTWLLDRRKGFPRHAYNASRRQQNRVFHDSLERGRYFGCAR